MRRPHAGNRVLTSPEKNNTTLGGINRDLVTSEICVALRDKRGYYGRKNGGERVKKRRSSGTSAASVRTLERVAMAL